MHNMPSDNKKSADATDPLVARAARPVEWVPLPNGRLGLPLPVASKKRGGTVYLATDGKTRLCEHGESPSAISQYASGSRARPADSSCTCQNVDGLTAGRFGKAPDDWPTPPPSYFEVLEARGAEEVELPGGRRARRLPPVAGVCAAVMLPCGTLRCVHGNSEATLRGMAKQPARCYRHPCDCVLGGHSWRRGRLQTLKVQRAF